MWALGESEDGEQETAAAPRQYAFDEVLEQQLTSACPPSQDGSESCALATLLLLPGVHDDTLGVPLACFTTTSTTLKPILELQGILPAAKDDNDDEDVEEPFTRPSTTELRSKCGDLEAAKALSASKTTKLDSFLDGTQPLLLLLVCLS